MGTYLNPRYQRFEEAIHSDIYVDKTEMLLYVNSVLRTNQKYISVSRPRRFGKTMAADMLCAYYGKEKCASLFEGLMITGHDGWNRYLNQFDVIRIEMTEFIKRDREVKDSLELLIKRILNDLEEAYPDVKYDPADLFYSMNRFYQKMGVQFVIILDEWDAVFRERKDDKDGQVRYLDFLRDWLKDKDYVALAYMTGILPIKKYGKHSALNMFNEYSVISPMQLAPYTGFTEEEVKALCEQYHMRYEDISNWYDGYVVNANVPVEMRELYRKGGYHAQRISIYSPFSVVNALLNGLIQNYWNQTETYEALAEYIRMNQDGLKDVVVLMMDGGRVKVDISGYQNDMTTFHSRDDVLALLIHLGYLGYDADSKEVFIPNREILDEFRTSTKSSEWEGTFQAFRASQELLQATWEENEEKVAELLEVFHDTAENKTYNSEAALSYAVQLAYYAAQKYYTTIQELDTGKGYADIVYLPSPKYPDKPVLLVELKYNKTVQTAADQIRDRNYPQKLIHYKGNILLVEVNYDRELTTSEEDYKHHSCRIERV